jgi:small subunit ribosomal protein S6
VVRSIDRFGELTSQVSDAVNIRLALRAVLLAGPSCRLRLASIDQGETLHRTVRCPTFVGPEGGTSPAMRPYEVMLIVNTSLDDQVVQDVINRSIGQLKAAGATVGRVEKWGRRKLAYEIGKRSDGYYALIEMTAEPTVIAGLDRNFFLADEIIRHKIIRLSDAAVGRSMAQPPPLDEIASGGGRDRD